MIQYKLNSLEDLTNEFINNLWDNEDAILYQSYYQELDFAYDILINHNLSKIELFSNKEEFNKFIEKLDDKNYDTFISLIYQNEKFHLELFFNNLIAEKNGIHSDTEIESFDILFFKFLDKINLLNTITLQVGNYILLSGKNNRLVKKQKKVIIKTNSCFLIHTLKIKRKSIYIYYLKPD